MKPEKEYAITACKELETILSRYGFKTLSKGLLFKRKLNTDITQEIRFQITSNLDIIVHIAVMTEMVKQWNKANYNVEIDTVLTNQLGYLTPIQNWKTWIIGKSDIAKKQFQKEVLFQIEEYIMPLFDKFNDINALIEELIENNGSWNKYEKKIQILPIETVLCYKNLDEGQKLLNNFLKENRTYLKLIKQHKLDEMKEFNFKHSEFFGANKFKIAFDKGLSLNYTS